MALQQSNNTRFPPGPMTSLASTRYKSLPVEQPSQPVRKQFVVPVSVTSVSHQRTSCLEGQYSSLQGPRQRVTSDVFSPPAACTAPPNTTKTSHQGAFPSQAEVHQFMSRFQSECCLQQQCPAIYTWWVGNQKRWQQPLEECLWTSCEQLRGRYHVPGMEIFIK